MGISTRQYQDIMNEYDAARRRNYMAEQERKERIYALIPEIRRIDEDHPLQPLLPSQLHSMQLL